jgi:hypothetical protein
MLIIIQIIIIQTIGIWLGQDGKKGREVRVAVSILEVPVSNPTTNMTTS